MFVCLHLCTRRNISFGSKKEGHISNRKTLERPNKQITQERKKLKREEGVGYISQSTKGKY